MKDTLGVIMVTFVLMFGVAVPVVLWLQHHAEKREFHHVFGKPYIATAEGKKLLEPVVTHKLKALSKRLSAAKDFYEAPMYGIRPSVSSDDPLADWQYASKQFTKACDLAKSRGFMKQAVAVGCPRVPRF